jgi:hypothetical protein
MAAKSSRRADARAPQIIPTDDLPAGHETHVVNFIDCALKVYGTRLWGTG